MATSDGKHQALHRYRDSIIAIRSGTPNQEGRIERVGAPSATRLVDAYSSVRKYSTLSAGSM
jgi:hypothetical protein